MVGPQQTTGLIGQKWKTGNGLELTGTNRPTQTTTPHTPTRPPQGRYVGVTGQTAANREASTIRSTPNPPTNHTQRASKATATRHKQPNNSSHTITTSLYHALPNQSSRWSQRQGNARHPSRTRKLSLTAPMVLHPPGCGRVGHHRAHTTVGPMRTTQSHGPHTQTHPKVDGTVSERSI